MPRRHAGPPRAGPTRHRVPVGHLLPAAPPAIPARRPRGPAPAPAWPLPAVAFLGDLDTSIDKTAPAVAQDS
ncbi:hypothetical protein ZWY2020_012839 [Hordeum vulgare]|nr:hypothetical protein ZWY2020_012839 [Hordeum vulgare]